MAAAKQGLSAQWSQAQEDAKRAVLQRTNPQNYMKSSWFSNLNTTCTIKSAPPRSPEILSLLSTKSGYLYKRNEQHVWQARWCCVVPHMFLYYFDADIGVHSDHDYQYTNNSTDNFMKPPPAELQHKWNDAVKNTGRRTSAPRSSLSLFPGTAVSSAPQALASSAIPDESAINNQYPKTNHHETADSKKFATLLPTGIVDLECYTSIHRPSSKHSSLLELAGDDSVNPDLRSFYFSAGDHSTEEEISEWTDALLNGRHGSLIDERDAYQQVCEGFSLQLQQLHCDLDDYERKHSDAEDEIYRIRSSQEEVRRSCFRQLQEALERSIDDSSSVTESSHTSTERKEDFDYINNNSINNESAHSGSTGKSKQFKTALSLMRKKLTTPRRSYRNDLETIRQQDMGLNPAVRVMTEYCALLESECVSMQKDVLDSQALATEALSRNELQKVEERWRAKEQEWLHEKELMAQQLVRNEVQFSSLSKALRDSQQELKGKGMEFSMHATKMKGRVNELMSHKKILKKEVIDLRQKLDEVGSELSLLKHHSQTSKLEVAQERKRTELLERYVEKMESQVKVQQNMMELMSQSQSVYAGMDNLSQQRDGNNNNSNSYYCVGTPPVNNMNLVRSSTNNPKGMPSGEVVVVKGHDVVLPTPSLDHANSNNNNNTARTSRPQLVMPDDSHSVMLRKAMAEDVDNKSHMSELTEDRTHKQILSVTHHNAALVQGFNMNVSTPTNMMVGGGGGPNHHLQESPGNRLPPTYVAVNNNNNNDPSSNNNSQTNSNNLNMNTPNRELTRNPSGNRNSSFRDTNKTNNNSNNNSSNSSSNSNSSDNENNNSNNNKNSSSKRNNNNISSKETISSFRHQYRKTKKRLSVAQRARMEAEVPTSTLRRTRSNNTLKRYHERELPSLIGGDEDSTETGLSNNTQKSNTNTVDQRSSAGASGMFSSVAQSITNVIHGTNTTTNNTNSNTNNRKKYTHNSESSVNTRDEVSCSPSTMSLMERQQVQRAKQIAFLKEQGLLQESCSSENNTDGSISGPDAAAVYELD